MSRLDRRRFLSVLATGLATPYVISLTGCGGSSSGGPDFKNLDMDSGKVFRYSVASGDPTPSGVILWTRISPEAVDGTSPLYLQIATDDAFEQVVMLLTIGADEISPHRDYTVNIDLDGKLLSNTRYYYRFIYRNVSSRTGRCRTAPAKGTEPEKLTFAMLTCQDYTNGYYGVMNNIANDDDIDFVMHMGDFIYETAGDPAFQSLEHEDRIIILPSSGTSEHNVEVAMNLEDYRALYRTYRSDPFLQRAMEKHTWIITRDDHETANDTFWDYDLQITISPDHPYYEKRGSTYKNDWMSLNNQLMLDSQQAWLEYVPARVQYDLSANDPHKRLKYYRHLQFGDFIDLFMLDSRSYRSPPPCGIGRIMQRYVPAVCNSEVDPETGKRPLWFESSKQTMLGHEQRDWLINGLTGSSARWQLIGNQTLFGPLWVKAYGFNLQGMAGKVPINVDAWDGYNTERSYITQQYRDNGLRDLVYVTGDLHTHIASHIKVDFLNNDKTDANNYVGVEFMTTSVTSAGLVSMVKNLASLGDNVNPLVSSIIGTLGNTLLESENDHIEYFDSSVHGFSKLEFTKDHCDWIAYSVDKQVNSGSQVPKKLRHFRKTKGEHLLKRIS